MNLPVGAPVSDPARIGISRHAGSETGAPFAVQGFKARKWFRGISPSDGEREKPSADYEDTNNWGMHGKSVLSSERPWLTILICGLLALFAQSLQAQLRPVIASYSPAFGAPGTQVTILGGNFSAARAVTFNTAFADYVIVSSQRIVATVPIDATTGPISVNNQFGTAITVTLFLVAPRVTDFFPALGPAGSQVIINGANFEGATQVTFNGKLASDFTVVAPSQIQAFVPAGAAAGPISVTTSAGTGVSTDNFIVTGVAPFITDFEPIKGPPGTVVIINGLNFANATGVKFNGQSAANFGIAAATQIHATVPAGATNGPIIITNPAGAGTSVTNFTVTGLAPIVEDFLPESGAPGTLVVINGVNLTNATAVKFNGTNAASFEASSPTQLHAVVPPNATTGPISVTNPFGTGASVSNFVVISLAPVIDSFKPSNGPPGTVVIIEGVNFTGASAVKFAGKDAARFDVSAPTQIHATVPAGATNGPISVTNPFGIGASRTNFVVTGFAPIVTDFAPGTGGPGKIVVVNGAHFVGTTNVMFNDLNAAFEVPSDTQLHTQVPEGATTGPIKVTNPFGTGVSPTNFFVAPRLSGFLPASGPAGASVLINGANFVGATAVFFNGKNASFNADSPTAIHATVPTNATTGPITVATPAGFITSTNDFVVTLAADLAISVSAPTNAIPAGTNLIYAIVVTNRGPNLATGVIVSDALPASVEFVTATVSQGLWAVNNGVFKGSLGNVTNGMTATIMLTVEPQSAGRLINLVSVEATEGDLIPTNNSTSITNHILPEIGPLLTFTRAGSKLQFFWPASATRFVIEVAEDLPPPKWKLVTSGLSLIGDKGVLTLDKPEGTRFYRLRKVPSP